VKFLFATTEIRKVPVTVLSRCQRFDLRRIEIPAMVAYLETILAQENVKAEAEALQLIARASEGSMRDALSLLDQAISHGAGHVKAVDVRDSLGLADRTRVIDLFEKVMSGNIAEGLVDFDRQHFEGADPLAILTDLGEFIHVVTRLKLVPDAAKDPGLSQTERERGLAFAKVIPIRALTMAWQIVLKGLSEVQAAARPKIAAEMVLVRLAYAADLPGPGEIIRDLKSGAYSAPQASTPALPNGGPQASAGFSSGNTALAPRVVSDQGAAFAPRMAPQASGLPQPQNFQELVALAAEKRDITLRTALERDVRVVSFETGRIEIALLERAERDLPNRLFRALKDWTGQNWGVTVAKDIAPEALSPTIHEEAEAARAEEADSIANHPAVRAILECFPGAKIGNVEQPAISDVPLDTGEPEETAFSDEDL
jgi:DNA polymerase-3 subunit gamma/tau